MMFRTRASQERQQLDADKKPLESVMQSILKNASRNDYQDSYKTEIKTTEVSDHMSKKTKKLKSIFTHSNQKVPTQE